VFRMGDAVACAKRGQHTPIGYYNIERMLQRVVKGDVSVEICGTCMDARGIGTEELSACVRRSTWDSITTMVQWSDKTLVF
jgi:uncharacterized protein involved in oxidation of intracellular sulfur